MSLPKIKKTLDRTQLSGRALVIRDVGKLSEAEASRVIGNIRSQIDKLPIFQELVQDLTTCERFLGRLPELIEDDDEPIGTFTVEDYPDAAGLFSGKTQISSIREDHILSDPIKILESMLHRGLDQNMGIMFHEEVHRLQFEARTKITGSTFVLTIISLALILSILFHREGSPIPYLTGLGFVGFLNSFVKMSTLTLDPYYSFLNEMHAHIAEGTVCGPDHGNSGSCEKLNPDHIAYILLTSNAYRENTEDLMKRLNIDDFGFYRLVRIVHNQLGVMMASGMTHHEISQIIARTKESDIKPKKGVKTFAKIAAQTDIDPATANYKLRSKRNELRRSILNIIDTEVSAA